MAISISRFSRTFFVSFLEDRDMALMATTPIEFGGGGGPDPLLMASWYSANIMPL
jgi:hypothetical protein